MAKGICGQLPFHADDLIPLSKIQKIKELLRTGNPILVVSVFLIIEVLIHLKGLKELLGTRRLVNVSDHSALLGQKLHSPSPAVLHSLNSVFSNMIFSMHDDHITFV